MARADSGCEVWEQDFLKLDLPEGVNLGVLPPDTPGRVPRWGVIGNNVWASIPTDEGGSRAAGASPRAPRR